MIAIVLVGGKNSLVSGLYPDLPPSLVPVNEKPFLYWLTLWLKAQRFKHIVYSASHHAEKISAWVNQMADHEPQLSFDIVSEARPLGTAGAAALCARRFPSPYDVIVNGNSILLTDIRPHIKYLKAHPHLDGIILSTQIANAGRFGTLETDPHHHLLAFKEKQPSNGMINAGVYVLRGNLLRSLGADKEYSFEYDCFPQWLKEGKQFKVIQESSEFIDIGTLDTLRRAHHRIENNLSTIQGGNESSRTPLYDTLNAQLKDPR